MLAYRLQLRLLMRYRQVYFFNYIEGKNPMRFHSLVLLVGLLSAISMDGYGQVFGGNPPSTKWQQINTDTVRVIFPKGDERRGERVAATVHQLQRKYANTIGNSLHKVNIVLQDETLISNGYVGLGPFRSEFYITPPVNAFSLGAVNWTDLLSVHEFRHVQQYSNFRKGLSKFASIILGQEGQAIANAAAIPNWFFEGDAVFNETMLTRQGRGSLPLFFSNYQSLFNAGIHYSYMKMRNGSYRNFVPDHYALGYLLVAYGRKQYGDDIWKKVTDDAARFSPLFYPFQGAVKKYTGEKFPDFVRHAMGYYQQQWAGAKTANPHWLTTGNNDRVVNYRYPYAADDGSLIVLKNSYSRIPAFYKLLGNGKEERIGVRDITSDDYFGYNNNRIVYTAIRPDLRWGNRDRNVIRILDIASGQVKQVAGKGRYFTPDISHNGKLVTAVKQDRDTTRLLVINVEDGSRMGEQKQSNEVYTYPKFSADDASVYWIVRNDKGQMGIRKWETGSGKTETIVPLSNRIIGFLQVKGDTLLFSTTHDGRDELWACIDRAGQHNTYRLAAYSTGIYQGTLDQGGQLVGSTFTAGGYRLGRFSPLWEKTTPRDELHTLYVGDAYQNKDHGILDSLGNGHYPVGRYSKGFNLLNFHSWRPYYDYPEYSFTIYGENVLNTFQSQLSYTYNRNEGSHKVGYDGIYGGFLLQPVFGVNQTWQRSALWNQDTTVYWNELGAYGGLRLPLNLTAGKQHRALVLQGTFNTDQVKWTGVGQKLFRNVGVNYVEGVLAYYGQVQQAAQHIYPHWGQSFLLQYRNSVNEFTAHQFLAAGSLYLPGLLRNHSLVINLAYQERDTARMYFFKNNFPFSRGYQGIDFPRMWKWGVNYHFPLLYPDWGVGQIVYFLRVRANAFFDYTVGKSLRTGRETPFRTAGGELYFDTKWWNQEPVTFGVRYSRLLDQELYGVTNQGVWEFILPVRLFK